MAVDLLTWPEIAEARAAVASAHAECARCERRYRWSPHGEKRARLNALQEAVQEALRAELRLRRLMAEGASDREVRHGRRPRPAGKAG